MLLLQSCGYKIPLIILSVLLLFGIVQQPEQVLADNTPYGKDIRFEFFINDRLHFFNDFFNPGEKKFNLDRNYHILYVNSSIDAVLAPNLRGVLQIESELLTNLNTHNSRNDFEFEQAFLQVVLPEHDWISISAGRHSLNTINGLLYYDDAPSIKLQADMERGLEWPLKFTITGAEIDHDNPYVHTDLKYNFSFLESVTFHFGWYRDTHNGIARIFNYLEGSKIYRSRSNTQWYGISLRKFLGNAFLRATFVCERGSLSLRKKKEGTRRMRLRGYLLDLNLDYNITSSISTSLFFFLASGDNKPLTDTFRSFVSIHPYVDKTNIFFNGGIDGQYSSDNVGLNGIQVPGVMCPGAAIDWRAGEKTWLKFVFAYMFTHRVKHGIGHVYGWETNFTGFYNLTDSLQLFMEYNLFNPGKLFNKTTRHREHLSTEILIGINYFFSSQYF